MRLWLLFLWTVFVGPHLVDAGLKLIFAQSVWKHGSRAPQTTYPNSKYQPKYYSPGPGELVPQGMQEHVNLARKLKQRYVVENRLVSKKYRSSEVYIRSSDFNRTITSAITHFAVFYFAEGAAAVDYPYDYMWPSYFTPVPVHVVPRDEDYLLYTGACEYSVRLNQLIYASPEYQSFLNESQALFSYLSKFSGTVCRTKDECFVVCDAIVGEMNLNLPYVEKWARDIWPVCIQFIADYNSFNFGLGLPSFNGVNLRTEIPKVKGGPLLWEIINRMRDKYNNFVNPNVSSHMEDLRYYVYSAHSATLSLLFAVLDFEDIDFDRHQNPSPSNALTFELWLDEKNQPIVKVLYWKRDQITFLDLSTKIHGCKYTSSGCTLDQFAARSEKYKPPEDMDVFCETEPS